MKILAVFFLSALVGCYGYKACIEERAENCLEKLLTSLVDDSSEEEICSELQNAIGCLESAVEACPGAKHDDDISDGIHDLMDVSRQNCQTDGSSEEEMKNCFEENEDYILECWDDLSLRDLGGEDDVENMDENELKCELYRLITDCFVERIDDKCGDESSEMAEEELSDWPEDIRHACNAADEADEFNLEDRRKKK